MASSSSASAAGRKGGSSSWEAAPRLDRRRRLGRLGTGTAGPGLLQAHHRRGRRRRERHRTECHAGCRVERHAGRHAGRHSQALQECPDEAGGEEVRSPLGPEVGGSTAPADSDPWAGRAE